MRHAVVIYVRKERAIPTADLRIWVDWTSLECILAANPFSRQRRVYGFAPLVYLFLMLGNYLSSLISWAKLFQNNKKGQTFLPRKVRLAENTFDNASF